MRLRVGVRLAIVVAIALLGAGCVPVAQPPSTPLPPSSDRTSELIGPLSVRDGWFVDANDRVVMLHGVNVVDKRPPYLPGPDEFGPADADLIADLGFNTVRLGFIWAGLEPERGVIDADYLDRYVELVDLLGSRGIQVLVDSHQDLWNERWFGEGAPDWAIIDDGIPSIGPLPEWGLHYLLEPGMWRAWDAFWANEEGIADAYIAAWEAVVARLADRPHVLGYDMINEPWAGTDFASPGIDARVIEPFYRRLAAAIRAVDGDAIVFWEPDLATQMGRDVTMTDLGHDQVAQSFHVYCAMTLFRIFTPGGIYSTDACGALATHRFDLARRDTDRIGGGWLLTEFGAGELVADVMLHADLADHYLVGWQYWNWKRYNDPTGTPDEGLVPTDTGPLALRPTARALERIYPRVVTGVPTRVRSTPGENFLLRFDPDPQSTGPTEVWVPARLDPGDGGIDVSGGSFVRSADGRRLLITADGTDPVEIRISAAA